MARPIPDPTDRAALFAADWTRPSCLPPRGPVVPNKMFESASVTADPVDGAAVPAVPTPPSCPAGPAPSVPAVRALSYS